jgi:transposase
MDAMAKALLTDELWTFIAAHLPVHPPSRKGGRPRISDRAALTGILFVLRTGIPWEYLALHKASFLSCANVVSHCPNGRLLVTIRLLRSYRAAITWKNRLASKFGGVIRNNGRCARTEVSNAG